MKEKTDLPNATSGPKYLKYPLLFSVCQRSTSKFKQKRAHIPYQKVNLQLATPASHSRTTIGFPSTLVLIQLPVDLPGKAVEDGLSSLPLPLTWESGMKSWDPGFELDPAQPLRPVRM